MSNGADSSEDTIGVGPIEGLAVVSTAECALFSILCDEIPSSKIELVVEGTDPVREVGVEIT